MALTITLLRVADRMHAQNPANLWVMLPAFSSFLAMFITFLGLALPILLLRDGVAYRRAERRSDDDSSD